MGVSHAVARNLENAQLNANPPLSVVQVLACHPYGGLESVVETLSEGLAERGHRVVVLAILDLEPNPHPFEITIRAHGIEFIPLRLPPRAYLRERSRLREILRRLAPHVVHTHGYRADLQAGSVARSLGAATVSSVHGFTGGDLKNRGYEWLQERALSRFDSVVAVSQPILSRLDGKVPAPRLHCIPNAWRGRRELLARQEARRALNLPSGAFVIGWVGRLSFEKGPDVLVESLAHTDLDSICCLIGEGPEREALVARTEELGLTSRVHFAGMHLAASRLFNAFDALALSSRTEGTPIVLFEAMDAGIPIVATRVGGVPDVLREDTAWLVEPDDPKALSRGLDALRSDPQRAARRVESARDLLAARFAVKPWLEAHEDLYRRTFASSRPRADATLEAASETSG